MDISYDIILKKFYERYVDLCTKYENRIIDEDVATSELKTIQESIGIYVSGLFEIKRRKKGGE